MDSKKYRFETLQIHAGLQPDEPTGARGVAIYPTAAYRFKNCDHAARLFELSEGGNIYTRLQNPTTTACESTAIRMADMPDETASAPTAPYRAAMRCSYTVVVGFCSRV